MAFEDGAAYTQEGSSLVRIPTPAGPMAVAPVRVVLAGGGSAECEKRIPVEHSITVAVEGGPAMRVACTPENLEALVLGRLYTEELISGLEDVASLVIREDGSRADVRLAPAALSRLEKGPFAGKSNAAKDAKADGGAEPSGTDETIDVPTYGVAGPAWAQLMAAPLETVTPIPWNVDQVFAWAYDFAADTPSHRITAGSHSCRLLAADGTSLCCEDLGRHNALDKVIGMALQQGVDLTQACVFSSGRIPADMIVKVIRAGIPVLISKAVPTDLGVRIAREANLTLICNARPDSITVYNDPLSVEA